MSSQPERVLEEFARALDENNVERLPELAHPDGRVGNDFDSEFVTHMKEGLAEATLTIESVEQLERTADTAVVRTEMSVDGVGFGETLSGGGETEWELRTDGDDWKIWDTR